MVRLRELQRTAVFAFSPSTSSSAPLIVTGTRAGAVSDDFSTDTVLELWDLKLDEAGTGQEDGEELEPLATLTTDSGFNDISWSEPSTEYPLGLIAAALENGSVDTYDAAKLKAGHIESARLTRTTKHGGSVKALQFNPHRPLVLASVGSKAEIHLYDFSSSTTSPTTFRLGASAARADDIECLDWNKQEKTSHILATGSTGGLVTVWDVKQKKDILTLNNLGRKSVSAVAWDPSESTRLATASDNDADPCVHLWSLRQTSAPERTLQGHELGVLGLAWCKADSELLLSCGKDNQTICWSARTGEKLGSFAAGSNWAFQTRWCPSNPSLIASASFDGKILVTSIQETNAKQNEEKAAATNQALDGEDFFAKATSQPQLGTQAFSLPHAPKWLARPTSVAFGFGGKLVRVSRDAKAGKSRVIVERFAGDDSIGEEATKFEERLKSGDLAGICESKIEEARSEEEKADWRVLETLHAGRSRKKLREYVGFADEEKDEVDELADQTAKLGVNGDGKANGDEEVEEDDDDFFAKGARMSAEEEDGEDDAFLANLADSDKKDGPPFSIFTASDSEADKSITRALLLGNFSAALDICLKEPDRLSDAFMIAVCGGQKCIDRAQAAYLKQRGSEQGGPNYLRLLRSVVGKDLWDLVRNADLRDWREVMASLCTYADEGSFGGLCEGLGDRLLAESGVEEGGRDSRRKDATFCFLAAGRLEKVVGNWVLELREGEKRMLESGEVGGEEVDGFEVHARCLQGFVEKVSVFRHVTEFKGEDGGKVEGKGWKLGELYRLYMEYADILAGQGMLVQAEGYLALVPGGFEGAEVALKRVRAGMAKAGTSSATTTAAGKKVGGAGGKMMQPVSATTARATQGLPPVVRAGSVQPVQQPLINQARNAPSPYAPVGVMQQQQQQASNPYAPPAQLNNNYTPAGYQPTQQQGGLAPYSGYQPPAQQAPLPPPPRAGTASPSVSLKPAAATKAAGDWNDMPANFFPNRQPGSRRGTPAPQTYPNVQQPAMASPLIGGGYGQPPRQAPAPLPPPPKAGERVMSPPGGSNQPPPLVNRPSSSAASAYAPPSSQVSSPQPGNTLPTPMQPPVARGASPYQPPPATSHAPTTNRYAPAPGSTPSHVPGQQRQVAPNPYAQPTPNPQYGNGGEGQGRAGQYAPTQQPQQVGYGAPPMQQQGYSQQAPPPPMSGGGSLGYGAPPQQGQYAAQQAQAGTPYGQPPQQQQHQQPPPPAAAAAPPPRGPPRNATPSGPPAPSRPQPVQQQSEALLQNQPPSQQVPQQKPKHPKGDRSHIPPSARPIVDILTPEVLRIKSVAPQTFKPQVDDMEKRINILFDHLNNGDLLSQGTVEKMVEISRAVEGKDWAKATGLLGEMQGSIGAEGGLWIAGVKRLINIGKATSK
ncbi:protein transport protein S31 [Elasticomyces elasticus]|nr:protein transport protein S31 [Elasticomyces elasticus]